MWFDRHAKLIVASYNVCAHVDVKNFGNVVVHIFGTGAWLTPKKTLIPHINPSQHIYIAPYVASESEAHVGLDYRQSVYVRCTQCQTEHVGNY